MNYVDGFIEFEISHDTEFDEHLYNYCYEVAYDMNLLVLDKYKVLCKPKTNFFYFADSSCV